MNHWAIRRALEDVDTLGWCERVYFREEGHELHGQWLGAIVGILTDPATAEPTGGITRTYIHRNVKIGKAKSLGGVGRLGIIRLSPDDEVGTGLHGCEGIESALSAMIMGFCPMWASGSTSTMEDFPVLAGVECLTIIADNDRKTQDEIASRRQGRARRSPALGRRRPRGDDEDSENTGGGRQRHHQAQGAQCLTPAITRASSIRKGLRRQARHRQARPKAERIG